LLLGLAGWVAGVMVVAGCTPADGGEYRCEELVALLEEELEEIKECESDDECIVVESGFCVLASQTELGCGLLIYNESRSIESVLDGKAAYHDAGCPLSDCCCGALPSAACEGSRCVAVY
jgi:hypothetical protein